MIFVSTTFLIKNMTLVREKNYTKIVSNSIKEIKVATSYDGNFFVCFLEDTTPICLINDYLYDFKVINCTQNDNWSPEYKVLYFQETDDFMLISRFSLLTTILNNNNKSIEKCNENKLREQENVYSINL